MFEVGHSKPRIKVQGLHVFVKIKLFIWINASNKSKLLGPKSDVLEKQVLLNLHGSLEGGSIVNWPFKSWDGISKCVIQINLEWCNMWDIYVYVNLELRNM